MTLAPRRGGQAATLPSAMSDRETTRTPPLAGPMGQVLLGLRSLFVRIAIFVTMAALLAWALGGTLWPRTSIRTIGETALCDGVPIVLVHQVREPRATYGIATVDARGRVEGRWPKVEEMTPAWAEALVPVSAPAGDAIAFAARTGDAWWIGVLADAADLRSIERQVAIDRLEAARQLARFAAGLPIQDEATQRAARETVLDAGE